MEENICGYINGYPIYRFIFEPIRSNMYIIVCANDAFIIDPFMDDSIKNFIEKKEITNATIILTHEHYDHISGVNEFRELCNCIVIAHEYTKKLVESENNNLARYYMALFINKPLQEQVAKAGVINNYTCLVDRTFESRHELAWTNIHFALVSTPGHSEGSICVIMEKQYIFTGDTLVGGAKIITRLPGGSKKRYQEYTKPFLENLDETMYVFPGHGEPSRVIDFDIL